MKRQERRPERKARRVRWRGVMEWGMRAQRGLVRVSFRGRRGMSNMVVVFWADGGGGGENLRGEPRGRRGAKERSGQRSKGEWHV